MGARTIDLTLDTVSRILADAVKRGQGQVGHEDAATTLNIYAQVLKRQDHRRHGEALDTLMAGAVASDGAVHDPRIIDLSCASGHRNRRNQRPVTG